MDEEVKEFPIEEEYKKNHGVTPQDIMILRKWLQTRPHLPEKHITDLDLVLAYHSCNKSTEVTKQLIDHNFTLRTNITDYFSSRTFDSNIESLLQNMLILPLPERSYEGNAVLYTQLINSDVSVFNCTESIKALIMILDLWQYEEGTWPGFEMVINFSGYTLSHIPKIDLRNIQLFACYIQEAIPLIIKRMHFINAASIVDKLLVIVKPFLKNELFNSIHTHKEGVSAVHKYMSTCIFPKDIGGNYKSIDECKDDVIKKLRERKSYFEAENKKRVVESLRPDDKYKKAHRDVMWTAEGLEGSFKKLDID